MTSPVNGRPPRIVAELGRPETPLETAERKAENSRRHRANQTLFNLVVALVACLGVVLFLVLVVVRPDGAARPAVDYRGDASQSQQEAGHELAAPKLPSGWSANSDGLTTGSDKIVAWSVGYLTPGKQYIGQIQGIDANDTWVSNELNQARATGSTSIGGADWTVYDRRAADDPGNYAYSISTVTGRSTIVLHGTASTAEFRTLAAAILKQIGDAP